MVLRVVSMTLTICILYVIAIYSAHAQEKVPDEGKVEEAIKVLERLTSTRQGLGALKKVISDIDADMQKTQKLEDLTRKRKGLEILQRILNEMEADLMYEQKRNCHFNLGGHCATESAAYVADHWHYLNSPLSPGRKRRDTGLYKKLMTGKLLQ